MIVKIIGGMTLFINDCINGQKEVVKLDGKKIGEFKLMSQIIHCFVQFFLGKIRPYSHTSSSLSIFTHYRGSNNQAVLALFRSVFLMCGSWRTSRHQLKLWNYSATAAAESCVKNLSAHFFMPHIRY